MLKFDVAGYEELKSDIADFVSDQEEPYKKYNSYKVARLNRARDLDERGYNSKPWTRRPVRRREERRPSRYLQQEGLRIETATSSDENIISASGKIYGKNVQKELDIEERDFEVYFDILKDKPITVR